MKAETPYVETEILLALMNGDTGRAKVLVREMDGVALSTFYGQALGLFSFVSTEIASRLSGGSEDVGQREEDKG